MLSASACNAMGKSIENMNLDALRTAIDAVDDEVQQGVVALKNLA